MKKPRRIVLALLVLLAVAAAVAYVNLNRFVRDAVVRETTLSLGVQTTASSACLSVGGHVLTLGGCAIDNPPGFSSDKLLTLDAIDLDAPYGELRRRPVRLNAVNLYRPRLSLERRGGTWNIQLLGRTRPQTDPVRLVIGKVTVTNAVVAVHPNLPGVADEIDVDVPAFTLVDVRDRDGSGRGVTIPQALLRVTAALAEKAMASGELSAKVRQAFSPQRLMTDLIGGVGNPLAGFSDSPLRGKGSATALPRLPSLPATRP